MAIIRHEDQLLRVLQRSPIESRSIVTQETGAFHTEVWEQFMPPSAKIFPHYHDVEETITVLSGEIAVTIDGEESVVGADSTLFIKPNIIHSIQNTGDEVVRMLAFFPSCNPGLVYTDIRDIVLAVQGKEVDKVTNMLETNKALVNCYTPETGDSLLHTAVRNQDVEMIRLLFENDADRTVQNNASETPLDLAKNSSNQPVMDIFKGFIPTRISK